MIGLLNFLVNLVQLAFDLFGWPGVGILVVAVGAAVWGLYQYGGQLFMWLLFRNFAAHGKILRGAKVEVHSVTSAPEPAKDAEDLEFEQQLDEAGVEDGPDSRYFFLETTITPDPNNPEAQKESWHPSSLMLVEAGRRNVELMEIDGAAFVADGWVIRGQQLMPFTKQECHGAARLKLHIAVRPDCRRLQFLYMKEVFGDIVLPEIPALATTSPSLKR
jgi:hypothetical protein